MIRVTKAELDALKAGAQAAGKPVGTWLRELGLSSPGSADQPQPDPGSP